MTPARARVLIVAGDLDDLATYSRWLLGCTERRLTIITASSPAAALDICKEYAADCVVLNEGLNAGTGLELLAQLAQRGVNAPVVAIGSSDTSVAAEFRRAGARDYLRRAELSESDLCSSVVAQLSPDAMRHQLALYRARERALGGDLAAALARMSFLAETGKLFAATRTYDEFLEFVVMRALPALAEVCLLDVIEGETLVRRVRGVAGDVALREAGKRLARGVPSAVSADAGRAIAADAAFWIGGTALAQAAIDDADIAELMPAGITAVAYVPLCYRESAMGALTLATTHPDGFRDARWAQIDDYAGRVAVAMANARISESERSARELGLSAKKRVMFGSRLSTLFAQSLDWETTLGKLMKLVAASVCDSAVIFAVEGAQACIRFVAAAANSAELESRIAAHYIDFPPGLTDHVGPGRAVGTRSSQFFAAELFTDGVDMLVNRRRQDLIAAWAPVSIISVPLLVKGVAIGVLTLVRDVSKEYFTIEDVAIAEDVARRTAAYLENVRLAERERGMARTLGQVMLPSELPIVAELIFAVRYFAGAAGMDVGGDWYDLIEIGGARVAMSVGDVVGRGVKAAAAMGQYRDVLRAYTLEGFGPAAALTRLNDFVDAVGIEAFATCSVVVLDRQTRRLRYASAGHPPPMLRLSDGTVCVLDGEASLPIGAWPRTVYNEKSLEMPIGATLVLYTDGLVKTRRRSAAEGMDVLRDALAGSAADIELMLDGVLRAVAPDHSDDIAVLAVEMLPVQSATLKRWVFRGIDRAIVRTIRTEFDDLLEAGAAADSDTFGARLILGELLSNVVRHAPGSFRLEFEWDGEYPELRLFDNGPGFAVRKTFNVPEDIMSVTGRGLFLISQISRSFSIALRTSGGLATRIVLPVRRQLQQLVFAVR